MLPLLSLRGSFEDIVIVSAQRASSELRGRALPPRSAADTVRGHLAVAPLDAREAEKALSAMPSFGALGRDGRALGRALEHGLVNGSLLAVIKPRRRVVMPVNDNRTVLGPDTTPIVETTWIGLVARYDDGSPAEGIAYCVTPKGSFERTGRLDSKGRARVEGLDPGSFEVSFPDVDAGEWNEGEAPSDAGDVHVVRKGDHLAGLAETHGLLSSDTIWNHPKNAELKSLRGSRHILLAGDEIFIPQKRVGKVSRPAETMNPFVLKSEMLRVCVAVRDLSGKAVSAEALKVFVCGNTLDTTTDGDGKVDVSVRRSITQAAVQIGGTNVPLLIGHIDPVEEASGWHARLSNLGYLPMGMDDANDGDLSLALEEFQCNSGIKVTGKMDSSTKKKLVEVHGC